MGFFLSAALKAPAIPYRYRATKSSPHLSKLRVIFVFCEREWPTLPNWASELGNSRVYFDNMAGGGIR